MANESSGTLVSRSQGPEDIMHTLYIEGLPHFDTLVQQWMKSETQNCSPFEDVEVLYINGCGGWGASHGGRSEDVACWEASVPHMMGTDTSTVRRLTLDQVDWSSVSEDSQEIVLGFRQFTELVELSLCDCSFSTFRQLQDLIRVFPHLRALCWNQSDPRDEPSSIRTSVYEDARPINTPLTLTSLWFNFREHEHLTSMCNWLRMTPTVHTLVDLNFTLGTIDEAPIGLIQEAASLQKLTIRVRDSAPGGREDDAITRCLTGHPNLHTFVFLVDNLRPSFDMEAVLAQIPSDSSLTELQLTMHITDPHDLSWTALSEILAGEHFDTLAVLSITIVGLNFLWSEFRLEDPELRQLLENVVLEFADEDLAVKVAFDERTEAMEMTATGAYTGNIQVVKHQEFIVTVDGMDPPLPTYTIWPRRLPTVHIPSADSVSLD